MRFWHRESGQATVEYAGVLLLVATVLLALTTFDIGPRAAEALASSVCAATGLTSCRPEDRGSTPAQRLRMVHRYAGGNLEDFLRYRATEDRDRRLDWSTDECSAPVLGSRGLGYDFADACVRHDFAYRNYEQLADLGPVRTSVDRIFLADMRAHCATRSVLLAPRCHQRALQYYAAVRTFGGRVRTWID